MSILNTRGAMSARNLGATLAKTVAAAPVDPYFSSVILLMHFEGASGSTTFTDERGHIVTRNGSAVINTVNPLYGTSSGRLTAGNSDYLSLAAATDWTFSGDFTIEGTIKPDVGSGAQRVIGNYGGNSAGNWMFILNAASMTPVWYINGANTWTGNSGAFTDGAVCKFALVRQGSTCTLYVNGAVVGTPTTYAGVFGLSSIDLGIGATPGAVQCCTGLIDEFRITKGVARYTGPYTPSTLPFPNS